MSLVVALQWLAASLWLTFNRRSNCESLKRFPVFSKKENTLPSHRGQIWPRYTRVDNMVGKKQLISRHWTTETAVGLVELLWMFVCNQGSSTIYLNILCFHMTQADCRGRGVRGGDEGKGGTGFVTLAHLPWGSLFLFLSLSHTHTVVMDSASAPALTSDIRFSSLAIGGFVALSWFLSVSVTLTQIKCALVVPVDERVA